MEESHSIGAVLGSLNVRKKSKGLGGIKYDTNLVQWGYGCGNT